MGRLRGPRPTGLPPGHGALGRGPGPGAAPRRAPGTGHHERSAGLDGEGRRRPPAVRHHALLRLRGPRLALAGRTHPHRAGARRRRRQPHHRALRVHVVVARRVQLLRPCRRARRPRPHHPRRRPRLRQLRRPPGLTGVGRPVVVGHRRRQRRRAHPGRAPAPLRALLRRPPADGGPPRGSLGDHGRPARLRPVHDRWRHDALHGAGGAGLLRVDARAPAAARRQRSLPRLPRPPPAGAPAAGRGEPAELPGAALRRPRRRRPPRRTPLRRPGRGGLPGPRRPAVGLAGAHPAGLT